MGDPLQPLVRQRSRELWEPNCAEYLFCDPHVRTLLTQCHHPSNHLSIRTIKF